MATATLMEPGRYTARIVGAVLAQDDGKSPAVVVQTEVIADKSGPITPVQRRIYLYLSEAAKPYTLEKLEALDFNGDFESPSFGTAAVEDGTTVICKHDEYNGETKEKWDFAPKGGLPSKADNSVIKMMNAEWKNWKKQSGGTTTPAKKPAAPAPAKPPTPAAKGPPAPAAKKPAKAKTRDEVWAKLEEVWTAKGKTPDEILDMWTKLINEASAKFEKDESNFGDAEWNWSFDQASLPF